MHFSGILVLCKPSMTEQCVRDLERVGNVDVYVTDHKTGRIVAVLDTETLDDQVDTLRRVQRLPHVAVAEPVYHYFGDGDERSERNTGEDEEKQSPAA